MVEGAEASSTGVRWPVVQPGYRSSRTPPVRQTPPKLRRRTRPTPPVRRRPIRAARWRSTAARLRCLVKIHRDLNPFPLADALKATRVMTMGERQWDALLAAAYRQGWILLEL